MEVKEVWLPELQKDWNCKSFQLVPIKSIHSSIYYVIYFILCYDFFLLPVSLPLQKFPF